MKTRYLIGGIIVLAFLIWGGTSFLGNSVEYASLTKAENSGKRVQVTGKVVREMQTQYDTKANTFTFFMRDDENRVAKVILTGAKPNNFEIATSVVAKGKYKEGSFHASEVLTKCPSKYEGQPADQHPEGASKKTL
jgi:cytochrome c-type biogenesis protein CcmE